MIPSVFGLCVISSKQQRGGEEKSCQALLFTREVLQEKTIQESIENMQKCQMNDRRIGSASSLKERWSISSPQMGFKSGLAVWGLYLSVLNMILDPISESSLAWNFLSSVTVGTEHFSP